MNSKDFGKPAHQCVLARAIAVCLHNIWNKRKLVSGPIELLRIRSWRISNGSTLRPHFSLDGSFLQVLTKDSVTVAVDAVVYYRVSNATTSITNVEDANRSTRLLAATTLRNVLGTKNLSEILADREAISHQMQVCKHYLLKWKILGVKVMKLLVLEVT